MLSSMTLVNVHRSPPMYDTHTILIDIRTPDSAMEVFWAKLQDALRTRPNDFNVAKCGMAYQNVQKQNAVTVDFYIAHCTNWSKGQQSSRCHFVISTIKVSNGGFRDVFSFLLVRFRLLIFLSKTRKTILETFTGAAGRVL
jgi:hypothetical protein